MPERLLCCLPVFMASHALFAQYALVPLDPAPGGIETVAGDIDRDGRVVGATRIDAVQRVAALWPALGQPPTVLGLLDGGTASEAVGVAGGLVVGTGDRGCGQTGSFLWSADTGLAPFGPDMCPATLAVGVNATGQALLQVGEPAAPIVWSLGGGPPRVLEAWGQPAQAFAIDGAGHVVGASDAHPMGGGGTRAIEWRADGTTRLLGRLDASAAGPDFALALNDAGVIVGQARLGGVSRAAVWAGGAEPIDAGAALGPSVFSSLVAVNAAGRAVGNSALGPFVWSEDDGARLLRDLVDASADGWNLASVTGINDDGWIVGNGVDAMGRPRGFVLFAGGPPCPADLDGDGSLTIFDFLAFQNLFDAGDPLADFDGDGSLTIFDFLAFQNAFDAGC